MIENLGAVFSSLVVFISSILRKTAWSAWGSSTGNTSPPVMPVIVTIWGGGSPEEM